MDQKPEEFTLDHIEYFVLMVEQGNFGLAEHALASWWDGYEEWQASRA